jgi:cobalt/nickel transport system permease protein
MFIQLEERYAQRDSSVHRLDPRTKLLVALALIVAMSLLPFGRWALYALVWVAVLAVSQIAKVGARTVIQRSFVALPFALAALALPFTVPGQVIGHLPFLNWPISLEGLVRAGSIVVKSWVSVQVALVMVMTTSLPDLLWALRALRVPEPLVAIASFMYRYLFVLADEVGRLLRARASRSGARAGYRAGNGLVWRGRVAGYMVGSLMLRSFERSERVYNAMSARGYAGELKNFVTHHFRALDRWVLAGTAIFVILLVVVGR